VEDNQSVVGNALPGVPSQDGSTGQASTGQAVPVTARTADATFPTATPPPVQAGTQLEARLRAHLKKHDGKSELLFVNRRARPFSANKLREKQLHPLLVKLGIPRGGFHSMRHGALVPCSQTVQHRLWCSGSYGTATHGLRWEYTGTWWAISNVMRLRIVQHASPSSRPNLVRNAMGTFVIFLGLGIWFLYHAWRGTVPKTWNPGEKLMGSSLMETLKWT
jgi:hypothetical protein